MIDNHIDHITNLDVVTPEVEPGPEPGYYQFIQFDYSINLDDFEKIHSGGSSGSYILRSIAHPNICMWVEREDFFRSLLQRRSDQLLINARALVARMEVELPEGDDAAPTAGQCKIDTNCPP